MATSSSLCLVWHHKLHEEWGKERLSFWRLGFSPTYDRDGIIGALTTFFLEKKILSYAVYESTGQHDLFLRIWLPINVTQEAFEGELYDKLSRENLQICDSFVVSRIVTHWVWEASDRSQVEPTSAVLAQRLSDSEISSINHGEVDKEQLQKFVEMNLVRPWTPINGFRFIILIPRPSHSFSVRAREGLRTRLLDILLSSNFVQNVSLYEGDGFAQFLIMGTIESTQFAKVNEIIDRINSMGLQSFFEVRTFTHVVFNTAGIALPLQDCMPLSEELQRKVAVEEYFMKEESTELEFKGSAFVNMNKFLFSGKKETSDEITNNGVLKTIVGFLNAGGGTLVIGVVEAKAYEKQKEAKDRLTQFPQFGHYYITGVDADIGDHDLDWFQLRLVDIIRTRIQPTPTSWLSFKIEEYQKQHVCVITVGQVISDTWFYLSTGKVQKFYVRNGNRTVDLSGIEADEYKRSSPRGLL